MSIKSDKWIRRMAETTDMISPFEPGQVREVDGRKIVSYGTSSYGYDIRCANEFKIFTNINSTIVDPKNFDHNNFVDFVGDVCIIRRLLGARLLRRGSRFLATVDQDKGDANGQQRRQCTHNAHQHCLLLHGRQRLFFRLCILSHSFHHSLYCALFQARCSSSWSARSAQLSASSTGWKGASSSRLP